METLELLQKIEELENYWNHTNIEEMDQKAWSSLDEIDDETSYKHINYMNMLADMFLNHGIRRSMMQRGWNFKILEADSFGPLIVKAEFNNQYTFLG